MKAHRLRKGARVHLTESELEGTGLLDVLKKVGRFFVKNKTILKPIASAVLDAGAAMYPQFAPARGAIKASTGVGIKRRAAPKRRSMRGEGIIPAGYGGF
jgi:hypothetical protein